MVRIVFYGTPAFAVPTLTRLLASSHQVVGVVTQPDRPRGRGRRVHHSPVKTVALEHRVPVVQPARIRGGDFLETLRTIDADLAVVAAYGRFLPDDVLTTPRLGTINVHASLLPTYRGAAPVHRAIIAGERETGVTIIRLVSEMDAGPMLARRVHPIGPNDLSTDVESALAAIGADLLLETTDALAAGTAGEEAQDHARATFAPRLTRDDGRVDWNASAPDIHHLIRGLHPWPHAFCFHGATRYLLHRSTVEPSSPAPADPGTIVDARGDRLIVATGRGGAIALTEIQPEGRRPLEARAFLAGHRWARGSRLTAAPP